MVHITINEGSHVQFIERFLNEITRWKNYKTFESFMIVRIEFISVESIKLSWIESRNNYFINLVRSINLYFLLPFFISKSILFQHIASSFLSSYDNSEKRKNNNKNTE